MIFRENNAAHRPSSTEQLVAHACSGDEEAFTELMCRYYHSVLRTAFSFLKNPEEVEDVLQEVAMNVFRKLHKFEGKAAFSTWLIRITINTSLMHLGHSKRRNLTSLEDLADGEIEHFYPLADSRPNPEQQCSDSELMRRLRQAVHRLPKPLREAAVDHLYDELTMIEVAEKRGLSVAAAKSRSHGARQRLGDCLKREQLQFRSRPRNNPRLLHLNVSNKDSSSING